MLSKPEYLDGELLSNTKHELIDAETCAMNSAMSQSQVSKPQHSGDFDNRVNCLVKRPVHAYDDAHSY